MAKKFNVREKILEKSTDLFYKDGFVKASIRDIVKAVGITNSTVYLYFKNKDEILFEIIFGVGTELIKGIQTAAEKYNDPTECLRAMILEQVNFSAGIRNSKKVKIFLEEQYQLPPSFKKKTTEQHRRIYDLYYSKICELEGKRLLTQKADKIAITFGILAVMNWVYRWFDRTGRLSVKEVAEGIVEIFFRGILKNQGAKGEECYSSVI